MRRLTSLVIGLAMVVAGCNVPEQSGDPEAVEDPTTTTVDIFTTTTTSPPATSSTTTASPPKTTTTAVPPTTTTTAPTTTTTQPRVTDLRAGLLCRDVAAAGFGYTDAVAYWMREGQPGRMDADRNGIPCETVWPAADVVAFWGDPLPTSTLPSVDYHVDEPTYGPAPLPGAGDFYGSGCSPGSSTLPAGIWFGRITTASATSVEFDLMCFAPPTPTTDGPGIITNNNTRLRTVAVDPSAMVFAIAPDGYSMLLPYAHWYEDPGQEDFCPPEGCWDVWLYVNSGRVTEIVQLWFP